MHEAICKPIDDGFEDYMLWGSTLNLPDFNGLCDFSMAMWEGS